MVSAIVTISFIIVLSSSANALPENTTDWNWGTAYPKGYYDEKGYPVNNTICNCGPATLLSPNLLQECNCELKDGLNEKEEADDEREEEEDGHGDD